MSPNVLQKITCPLCQRELRIPAKFAEYMRSVTQVGCDECVWAIARQTAEKRV